MKKYVFILFLTAFSITIQAQKGPKKGQGKDQEKAVEPIDYSENFATVNNVVNTLYDVVSGKKDEERDWKLFKLLFHPDAKLITAGRNNEREFQVKFMGAADYMKSSSKWIASNGFVKKEMLRKTEEYGRMAHVFSSYKTYNTEDENKEDSEMRGINSIQLLNDGERWWILNMYWTQETWLNPIPNKYLD
ncbi:hypothetical protein V6246_04110 [Algibacter sp. TI.3.09]|uniref:hypothetical protein n=1 Tax=Algibacter sp. TI.3.09 TaxID=3121298 RepID=UPI00311E9A5B